jgi:hypothetical protein
VSKVNIDPFIEVITDEKFNAQVVDLCRKGYRNTEEVMKVSIGFVTFVCGESCCLFYSEQHKTFHVLDNGKKELVGFHTPAVAF